MIPEDRQMLETLKTRWRDRADAINALSHDIGERGVCLYYSNGQSFAYRQAASELDELALLLAEAPQPQEEKADTATRVGHTQYQQPLATAASNEVGPTVPSCRCPAGAFEDCPLTQDECDARTRDYIGHPWFGARLRHIYDGFVRESMNGVVCSIPDSGLNTPPHRLWCVNCQRRYMELKALVEMLERPLTALPEPRVIRQEEEKEKEDQARVDDGQPRRLGPTGSIASKG